MDIAFLVVGLLTLLGGAALLWIDLRRLVKNERVSRFVHKDALFLGFGFLCLALSGGFLAGAIITWNEYAISSGDATMAILGGILTAIFFSSLWCAFYVRFYKPKMDNSHLKWVKLVLYGSIPCALLSFLLFTEGLAPYLTYPLYSGIHIGGDGISLLRAGEYVSGGLHIAWYGVIMIGGALVSYFVSDHYFYQKYGKHGMLDGTLLVAFPAGVIGARIWYVVGNWNGDGAGGPNFSEAWADGRWYEVFEIWNGGLTIIGGAVAGIIAGVLFLHFTKKYVDIRWAVDVVVPTILIAQAIGRWGNFFNCEVYGAETSISSWSFLPSIIINQMHIANNGRPMAEGMMHVPLFLIESVINLAGYFIIAKLVPFVWRKYRPSGSLLGLYMVWYGIVRMIMEPLRDPSFNMGADGDWSFWNSLAYIIIGFVFIGGLYLYDFLMAKKKEKATQEGEGNE